MGKSGGGKKGGSDSDFVTLTIPRKHAQDLVHALTLALGSEAGRSRRA